MEAYEPRSFRFIELLTLGDWRMKLYGIAWRRELPRAHLLEAAKRIAAKVLRNAVRNNYKVGFIGVHDGRNACLVFVDYWGNEDELFHDVFLPRSDNPDHAGSGDKLRFIGLRLGFAPPIVRAHCLDQIHLAQGKRA